MEARWVIIWTDQWCKIWGLVNDFALERNKISWGVFILSQKTLYEPGEETWVSRKSTAKGYQSYIIQNWKIKERKVSLKIIQNISLTHKTIVLFNFHNLIFYIYITFKHFGVILRILVRNSRVGVLRDTYFSPPLWLKKLKYKFKI